MLNAKLFEQVLLVVGSTSRARRARKPFCSRLVNWGGRGDMSITATSAPQDDDGAHAQVQCASGRRVHRRSASTPSHGLDPHQRPRV